MEVRQLRHGWESVEMVDSVDLHDVFCDETALVLVQRPTVKSKVSEFHTFSCATAEFHAFYV